MAEGIRKRHWKGCPARRGERCRCGGAYEASVYSPRDGRKLYKSFARESEARSWRAEAKGAIDQGRLRAPNPRTLQEVAAAWLRGAERGEVRNRSGRRYKPSTLRGYRAALTERVLPEFELRRLGEITTSDLQALVDVWQADGQAPSTIRNSLKPLQAIYRRARSREGIPINPTHDLELPAPDPGEVEIVSPAVAAALLDVLPIEDRLIWGTALYAGLRYGELRALRSAAIDLGSQTIRVRESWDPKEGSIAPKTRTSQRTTPMPGVLLKLLLDWHGRRGEVADDQLVFADGRGAPFHAASLYRRADHAWTKAGLTERLRLHQARHTYASFMIAAGVNAKALGLHGPFLNQGHLRPLRPSDARH
jgi:integrase